MCFKIKETHFEDELFSVTKRRLNKSDVCNFGLFDDGSEVQTQKPLKKRLYKFIYSVLRNH